MVISLNFLSWWISCPVSKYQKVREKAEYLICSLASNFWPVTNIRKTWTWEFVLSLNSWNLNLKSKRVHLPRSWQKKPVYRPLEEKWRTKRLSCLLSHRKQKEVTEKSKGKKKQQSDKRVKENRMNAEAWRSVLAAQWREKQKLTAPGIPRRSPIQVLTRPDPA